MRTPMLPGSAVAHHLLHGLGRQLLRRTRCRLGVEHCSGLGAVAACARGRRRNSSNTGDTASSAGAAVGDRPPSTPRRNGKRHRLQQAQQGVETPTVVDLAGLPGAAGAQVQHGHSRDGHKAAAAPAPAAAATATAATAVTTAAFAPAAAGAGESAALHNSTSPSLCDVLPIPTDAALEFPDTALTLRDYQREAIREVVTQWKEQRSGVQLVMLPTGCGKTVVFAALARYMSQHYLPHQQAALTAAEASGAAAAGPAATTEAAAQGSGSGSQRDGRTAAVVAAAAADGAESGSVAGSTHTEGVASSSSSPAAAGVGAAVELEAEQLGLSPAATQKFRSWRSKGRAPAREQLAPSGAAAGAADTAASGGAGSSDTGDERIPPAACSCSASGTATGSSTPAATAAAAGSSSEVSSSSSSNGGGGGTGGKHRGTTSSTAPAAGAAARPAQPSGFNNKCPAERKRADSRLRVLVLAHRGELLHQAEEKFSLMWPGCNVSWLKAARKEFFGQVVVASVQTAVNCIPQLQACNFNLVIVDEAHHSCANTYKTILMGLGFIEEVPWKSSGSSYLVETDDPEEADLSLPSTTAAAAAGGVQHHAAVAAVAAVRQEPVQEQSSQHWQQRGDLPLTDSNTSSMDNDGQDAAPRTPCAVLRALHNPNSLCVGFTATPYRMKEAESRELYDIFTHVYAKNISDMIKAKHLSQIHSRKVFTWVNLKGVSSQGGDFVTSRLSPVINSRSRNRLVLAAYLDYCTECDGAASTAAVSPATQVGEVGVLTEAQQLLMRKQHVRGSSSSSGGSRSDSDEDSDEEGPELSIAGRRAMRKALGFAVDIEHANALNELFINAGVRSAVVHSKMPLEETKFLVHKFKKGELDVLWNVEMLTEGFDEPSLNAVLMARPTKSRGLYTQMLGRGLRRAPGKGNCLVLDFTDKFHKLDTIVDVRVLLPECYKNLDAKAPPKPKPDEPAKVKTAGLEGGEVSVLDEQPDPQEFAWRRFGQHWMQSLFSEGSLWLVNIAGMGPRQRQLLGLPAASNQLSLAATAAASEAVGTAVEQQDDHASTAAPEDVEDAEYALQDRYVVLHQPGSKEFDPFMWTNVAPHVKHGMTELDAYGTAIDYLISVNRQAQAQAVRRMQQERRAGTNSKRFYPKIDQYKQNAKWRQDRVSDAQLRKLKELQVELSPEASITLSKGEASDLIVRAYADIATQQQLEALQGLLPAGELANLPVPLLAQHAAKLGGQSAVRQCEQQRQQLQATHLACQ